MLDAAAPWLAVATGVCATRPSDRDKGGREWHDGGMTESWKRIPVSEVRVGDRVRLESGAEVLVSRIEPRFMGMDTMVAFIEDTPARWYKQPLPQTADVEVERAS